jgi:predicted molibdopterin-dependent oxidoreductase YjgC
MPLSRQTFSIRIEGQPVTVRRGQTIAAALVAAGHHVFRYTENGSPRGLFCGMGVCFDCLVTVNGIPDQRACMTLAEPDMEVRLSQKEEKRGDSD